MTELPGNLEALGRDLAAGVGRLVERRRRRRIRLRVAGGVTAVAFVFCTVAVASGIGPDLQLDPTKWSILGGGSVDEGRGEYVHAQGKQDGRRSTFMVEHDQGMDRYEAFLLHDRLSAPAAADSPTRVRTEPGAVCTRAELARAETVALETLRRAFPRGTDPDVSKGAVDEAVRATFAGGACRGLEYAAEIARLVYAGVEPSSNLMPGVR